MPAASDRHRASTPSSRPSQGRLVWLRPSRSCHGSDAFFPFADCVEIAHQAGVDAVIQPGGSIRDQDTIDYCNANA
ncbi:hypothetical protein [Paramuribaculum intestinale]|uniref:hypothetical protein n=1 Tax=Paramuribaculum intestinale TaxID=2094151 RepID=UPI003F690802